MDQGGSAPWLLLCVKWGPLQESELRIDIAYVSTGSYWLPVGNGPQGRSG